MRLSTKLLLTIIPAAAIIYLLAFSISHNNTEKIVLKYGKKVAESEAENFGNKIKSYTDQASYVVNSLGLFYQNIKNIPLKERRKFFAELLKLTLTKNENFLAIWSDLEPNALDGLDSLYIYDKHSSETGRFSILYYRDNDKINTSGKTVESDEEVFASNYYNTPKNSLNQEILPPYKYSFTGNPEDSILQVSIAMPILEDGVFKGVTGVDLGLDKYQKIIEKVKPLKEGYAFLISDDGTMVAHPKLSYIGKKLNQIDSINTSLHNLTTKVKSGTKYSFKKKINNEEYYLTFVPVKIGISDCRWTFGTAVPISIIKEQISENFSNSLKIILIGLLIFSFIVFVLAKGISRPLIRITRFVSRLANGEIEQTNAIKVSRRDEIGKIIISLNKLLEGLNNAIFFSNQIGKGNLDTQLDLMSDKDMLGKALIGMKESLKTAKEDEDRRKIDDQNRNWVTQGIAKFSEILRRNNDNMEDFTYEIISNLVKYLEANQGGFFLLNDEDDNNKHLELIAAYAYNTRKYLQNKIEIGITLVGRCFQESETIYMTEIPQDYIRITSGLGDENPNSVLIVPLKFNDEVYGVLELASFKKIQKFQIEFVEKIAESIASTISNVKINLRTAKLLREANIHTEKIQHQEESTRFNMDKIKEERDMIFKRENKNIEKIREFEKMIQESTNREADLIKNLKKRLSDERRLKLKIQELQDENEILRHEIIEKM